MGDYAKNLLDLAQDGANLAAAPENEEWRRLVTWIESALIRAEEPGAQAVARALAIRYLKRVVAHLMNVLSTVVMPGDRLDYLDEDPEDRPRA